MLLLLPLPLLPPLLPLLLSLPLLPLPLLPLLLPLALLLLPTLLSLVLTTPRRPRRRPCGHHTHLPAHAAIAFRDRAEHHPAKPGYAGRHTLHRRRSAPPRSSPRRRRRLSHTRRRPRPQQIKRKYASGDESARLVSRITHQRTTFHESARQSKMPMMNESHADCDIIITRGAVQL